MQSLKCVRCSKLAKSERLDPSCEGCGGAVLFSGQPASFPTRAELDGSPAGVWRYRAFLPPVSLGQVVSLGEGGTPLLRSQRLGKELGLRNLLIKDESRNPTGSFMDRGSTVLLSLAKGRGVRECDCVTTGNLGASLAAYCAKAGVRAVIKVPPNVDRGKLYQMLAYGAELDATPGRRDAGRHGEALSVSASNPFILEGEKTTGFELAQELGWKLPDVIVVPVGTGGHLTMIWRAIQELRAAGLAEGSCRLLGVRLGTSFIGQRGRGSGPGDGEGEPSPAELESEPLFGAEAASSVSESGGRTVEVSPREMMEATGLLARTEGIFAEPSGSSVVAAIERAIEEGFVGPTEMVVCVITGAGLKDTRSVTKLAREARKPEPAIPFGGAGPAMGRTKVELLHLLQDGPGYGYDLRTKLSADRAMSTASVYQHLTELEAAGMVRRRGTVTAKGRERVFYEITGRGTALLALAGRLEELAGRGANPPSRRRVRGPFR
ncbi:MAG: pyridoxal-phosphate dependent enzyme [Nitrososphaerota archaeon]|nr:pyridoxal-phosphate dependent enzyme [Nitrososphaerota archaeon]MDG6954023.1 pyridoxal-phosphate dependent enzyme [Nitrososphaerota archaeon]